MTPQAEPTDDDLSIGGGEMLLRFCKNPYQIVKDADGMYILSPQVFAANGSGCSIEFESLLENEGLSAEQRAPQINAVAALKLLASEARGVVNMDKNNKNPKALKVAYTPIQPDEPDGPNTFHGDIFPPATGSARKALLKIATSRAYAVQLDQTVAESFYKTRKG
tara:strand:+ start:1879 stop:2373 length:495 start_codon:yes stop_codon:yes gene_type:complete